MHALVAREGVRYRQRERGPGMIEGQLGFGALLRRYRMRAGLTQAALAAEAGLSLRGISDLERGLRRVPYPATVKRLVATLGLGMAE